MILLALALASTAPLLTAEKPLLPCAAGKTLTYRGHVRWTQDNSSLVHSKRITSQTRILSCRHTAQGFEWDVEGLPEDLIRYGEPGFKPSKYVITQTAEGFEKKQIEKPHESEQYLRFPGKVGNCLSDSDSKRNDSMYCWLIESTRNRQLGREWKLAYRTLASYEIFTIIPGVGITSFEYVHNGTVSSVKLHLVNK